MQRPEKKLYRSPAGRIRTYSYDKAGKALGVDLGQAGQVSYNSYDWNRPKRITLPGGASLNFSYNGLQQVSTITSKDPAANPLIDYNYSYSACGNINKKSTEHGDYDYVYDSLYRLTEVTSPTEEESYQYDPLSNRLSSKAINNWSYNRNNQLTNYSTTSFKYDKHGNMVEKTIAGQKSSFTYNEENRLQEITDNNGTITASYYYDPYGRRLWKDLSGSKTYFHYNDEGLAGEYNQSGEELKSYGYQPGSTWSSPLTRIDPLCKALHNGSVYISVQDSV